MSWLGSLIFNTLTSLNRQSERAIVVSKEREHAYTHALDLQERMDRLLVHYGLEGTISREAFGDFHDVPFEQGYLLLVPILEAQKRTIDELRDRIIWGDDLGRG